jgi:hypothetical protein
VTPASIVSDAHMTKIYEVKATSASTFTLTSVTGPSTEPGAAP